MHDSLIVILSHKGSHWNTETHAMDNQHQTASRTAQYWAERQTFYEPSWFRAINMPQNWWIEENDIENQVEKDLAEQSAYYLYRQACKEHVTTEECDSNNDSESENNTESEREMSELTQICNQTQMKCKSVIYLH